jgi:hypothetical protein
MKLRNVISCLVVSGLFFPGVAFAGEPVVIDDGTQRADDFEPDQGDAPPDGEAREDDGDRKKKKRKKRRDDEEDEEPVDRERDDRARFRGGIAGEGGAIIIPTETSAGESSTVVLGAVGVQGQIGVQINNLVGVYAVPSLDVLFGEAGGIGVAAAILVDFTIEDMVSIGVGPDVGAFAAFGIDVGGANSATFAGGANAGARIHLAVHPVVGIGENGIRRKAFSIGLETRLLGGFSVAGSVDENGDSESGATQFVFSPLLTIGYTAF